MSASIGTNYINVKKFSVDHNFHFQRLYYSIRNHLQIIKRHIILRDANNKHATRKFPQGGKGRCTQCNLTVSLNKLLTIVYYKLLRVHP